MPTATNPQHMEALALADEVRLARAELKRRIAAGRHSILAVVTDPPECCARAKPIELMKAVQWIGDDRARQTLRLANVSETRALGDLTDGEKTRLCMALRQRSRV